MLYIQDPSYADSKQLLDVILECCPTANFGGGAYAFVSADGINLLIGDPIFINFLERGQFLLIIGMDEITNTRSLTALNHYMALYPNLQVKAFLHNTIGSTLVLCGFQRIFHKYPSNMRVHPNFLTKVHTRLSKYS